MRRGGTAEVSHQIRRTHRLCYDNTGVSLPRDLDEPAAKGNLQPSQQRRRVVSPQLKQRGPGRAQALIERRGLEDTILLAGDLAHELCLALMKRSSAFVRGTKARRHKERAYQHLGKPTTLVLS